MANFSDPAACFEESPAFFSWDSFNEERAEEGLPPVAFDEWYQMTADPYRSEAEEAALLALEAEVELP